jgi:sigma-B regulation protein RsbU (phosphoserine phosphatase)
MYSQDRIDFPVGSTLMLYTDGITEAQSPEGDQWGMERALASAAGHASGDPQALVDGWLADMGTFSAGIPNEDDVTVIAFRYLG